MGQDKLKFCFIIPCYEKHALKLQGVIEQILPYQKSVLVVDDGSSDQYAIKIKSICDKNGITYLRRLENGGKGAAIKTGIQEANNQGFTHALQVDSDGQHDIELVSKLMGLSENYPKALISGHPKYDDTVPKGRLWGRYLTHVWVWVETLSFNLIDSMCGFRSYPIQETVNVLNRFNVGDRMDFDTEIMVKLYWNQTPSIFFPIKVKYPEDGESYFHYLKDNILITKMHTKLVFGMIPRFFSIIKFNMDQKNWIKEEEKGNVSLIKFTLFLYDILGRQFLGLLIPFISFYYWLFAKKARESSKQFKRNYLQYCEQQKYTPIKFNSYIHLKSFSYAFLDKFAVWKKKITHDDLDPLSLKTLNSIADSKKGCLFISSHYGNIEISRALGTAFDIKYSALIYTKNSKMFMNLMNQIDPDHGEDIIPVEKFDAAQASAIHQKLENGEWIFSMGDRLTEAAHKNIPAKLLGKDVSLPLGPFLLAYLNDVPLYSFHCYKKSGKYFFDIKLIEVDIEKSRKNRDAIINGYAAEYLHRLEELIIQDPTQWYNFYNYWNDK